MPIGPARMPLMDHLGELRMRIVRIVVVLIVGIFIFYLASPTIGQFMLEPIKAFIPGDTDGNAILQAFTPFEAFAVRFQISLWASVVAGMPVILWQLLAFFLPALKPNERKWFIPTFAAAVALFILGTVFCYFIILRPAFAWLTDQAAGLGTVLPQMSSYIDIIIKFELGFGFAFELPLIVFYLVVFGVVPYKKLRGAWRVVYVVLMVISAMVTPDASPVTMLLMFAALVALYEVSLLIARLVLGSKLQEQNEKYERELAEKKAEKEEREREREEAKAEVQAKMQAEREAMRARREAAKAAKSAGK